MEYKNMKEKPAETVTLVRMYGQPKRSFVVNQIQNADGTWNYEEIEMPVNVWSRDDIVKRYRESALSAGRDGERDQQPS